MAAGTIRIGRAETGSSSSARFDFTITSPTGSVNTVQWPSRQIRYDDMAAIAGWNKAQGVSGGTALPAGIAISPPIPQTRLWLTSADILQAIAEQCWQP